MELSGYIIVCNIQIYYFPQITQIDADNNNKYIVLYCYFYAR